MAKSEALGKCTCPDCGFVDAEIKTSKSGLAYRWCPDCNLQTFARNQTQSDRMINSMRKGSVSGTGESEKKTPVSDAEKPKKSGFDLGALT